MRTAGNRGLVFFPPSGYNGGVMIALNTPIATIPGRRYCITTVSSVQVIAVIDDEEFDLLGAFPSLARRNLSLPRTTLRCVTRQPRKKGRRPARRNHPRKRQASCLTAPRHLLPETRLPCPGVSSKLYAVDKLPRIWQDAPCMRDALQRRGLRR